MSSEQWAWFHHGAEEAEGPYASREEALNGAREHADVGDRVHLGHCIWPDPGDFVPVDIDDVAEKMDEEAFEGEYGFYDEAIFDLRTPADIGAEKSAEEELEELMEAWARKWFKPACWKIDVVEDVVL